MTTDQTFAQGARCGHIEGKGRVGQYVSGEESELSWAAADENTTSYRAANQWAAGYRHGYVRGASGDPLEAELAL